MAPSGCMGSDQGETWRQVVCGGSHSTPLTQGCDVGSKGIKGVTTTTRLDEVFTATNSYKAKHYQIHCWKD